VKGLERRRKVLSAQATPPARVYRWGTRDLLDHQTSKADENETELLESLKTADADEPGDRPVDGEIPLPTRNQARDLLRLHRYACLLSLECTCQDRQRELAVREFYHMLDPVEPPVEAFAAMEPYPTTWIGWWKYKE